MKSQDIGLLFKLISLHKQEAGPAVDNINKSWPMDWQDWDSELDDEHLGAKSSQTAPSEYLASRYTARSLEESLGISKSQINLSLNRCLDIGLIRTDRKTGLPRTNTRALIEFIVYGIKYVFPTKPGSLTRGIATAFAAPVLNEKLFTAGELILVWPYARGNTKGQTLEPLFKSTPYAVKRDPEMYALLALTDAIRIGKPREANLAADFLNKRLSLN